MVTSSGRVGGRRTAHIVPGADEDVGGRRGAAAQPVDVRELAGRGHHRLTRHTNDMCGSRGANSD